MSLIHLPEEYLKLVRESGWLLLDTRSPSEYRQAHIPGAINLPLLNDEHRAAVGTAYKQQGRDAAVLLGFELVGPSFAGFVKQVRELTENREISLYCWRGGMRSGIMAWVLELAGYRVHVLKGGYKAYRARVREQLATPMPLRVLGGRTGSGKTELLQALAAAGEQVIDLEALANHKGSAFGGLGQEPQPSNEQFENLLAGRIGKLDPARRVWIENESRTIGRVKLPDTLYEAIRNAPVTELVVPDSVRRERILHEYESFPVEQLAEKTAQLQKRLGLERTRTAITALHEGRLHDWLDCILPYYDKTYDYGNSLRQEGSVTKIEQHTREDFSQLAHRLKLQTNNQSV